MGPSFFGVYIIGKGVYVLCVTIIILESYFDYYALLFSIHIDRSWMQRCLVLIEMFHKVFYPSFIEKDLTLSLPLIGHTHLQSSVKECELSHALCKGIIVKICDFKYFCIRFKSYLRTPTFGLADDRQGSSGLPSFKALLKHNPVLFYLKFQPLRKSINYRDSNSMQTPRNSVSLGFKFTSSMEFCKCYFGGTPSLRIFRVRVSRDSPAIVNYGTT